VSPRGNRHAYILILPSLFTTGNLFCGFYAIIRCFNGDFERAAYAIIFAGIFDLLDGRVARMTKTQSHFGVEYDSIADVVSFGLAPAILAYTWGLESFQRLGWVGAFFFVACGALRLARFNAGGEEQPKSYFVGLPIPAAANLIATLVIAYYEFRFSHHEGLMLFLIFTLGFLMVSTIRYRTFKDFDLKHRRRFFELVILVAAVACVAIKHEIALLVIMAYYVIWGALQELMLLVKSWSVKTAKKTPEKQPLRNSSRPKK